MTCIDCKHYQSVNSETAIESARTIATSSRNCVCVASFNNTPRDFILCGNNHLLTLILPHTILDLPNSELKLIYN